ncbi:small integral membrane protein 1 [Danio rerio]|uniref:Small integral membrane protein 1 n=1 Tax=Danio rerio TaxID=7955 RepID=A0A8M1NSC3_DANRE|nr:small integral membrane protein 1 [Danio rerio]NP_001189359.2 small integral membrane protein 1 [Danio rerio]XP_056320491.1 small integral membrane protein 1 [Danio aesculapii]|eukprot:NP_001157198.1 small integral membrane protein 1 [Danio rerio]
MESNGASVQYNRWSEDNITLQEPQSRSRLLGIYNRVFTGRLVIMFKIAASLTVMVVIYIAGYITGFYVHQCG